MVALPLLSFYAWNAFDVQIPLLVHRYRLGLRNNQLPVGTATL